MKKSKEVRKMSQRGITLVALVITIVILIILATISLQAAFGENGLITRAEEARNRAVNSTIAESESMNKLAEDIENMMPFEPTPTPEPPTGGADISRKMTNGVIEIKWLSGTSNNVSDTPNAPVTKSISNGKMELVKFDSGSKTWEAGEEYSYTKGTGSSDNNSSKWANAKVTIGGVDSYFVWIPRYAYRIIYFDSAESKKAYQEGTLTETDAVANGKIIGYSDSRGIVDASGKKVDSIASTTKIMVSRDYFMVHPAFINDVDAGGWTSELPGIWIGKYETSSVEGNSDSTSGDNVTTKTAKVQPGLSSWRYITIGNMYTVSKNYSAELKSHMLKNSEWGAVAYLTESTYGRNGTEVAQNTNSSYTTGGGTGTAYYDTNKLQSTTGNEYGIYDLSGGTYEYVVGYYRDGDFSHANSTFTDGTSDEYSTAYEGVGVKTAYKYGDATMETNSWHSDGVSFVFSDGPFFRRGGTYSSSAGRAGLFCFYDSSRWRLLQLLLASCLGYVM